MANNLPQNIFNKIVSVSYFCEIIWNWKNKEKQYVQSKKYLKKPKKENHKKNKKITIEK